MKSLGCYYLLLCLLLQIHIVSSDDVCTANDSAAESCSNNANIHADAALLVEETTPGTSEEEEDANTITIDITPDLLHQIHAALEANGVSNEDKDRIQEVAMAEVHKWYRSTQQQEQKETRCEMTYAEYDTMVDPETEFPYPLVEPPPPPDSLDLHDWTPKGGNRYAEYTTGRSPYVITPQMKNKSDTVARSRRHYIKRAMQHAWSGYETYAWGADELRPQSQKPTNHWAGIAVTLVDSLDTLWLLNMTQEFQRAKDYVKAHQPIHDVKQKVSFFETTIRSLGGLLGAYDWSKDPVFLEEALDLARRLMKAFPKNSTLPYGEINLQNGSANMIPWAGGNAILSEFGSLQIEFRYLDEIVQTEETKEWRDKVEGVFEMLHEMAPDNGLYPYYMRQPKGTAKPFFSNDHFTFGAMADSFYEYMLKLWLQGGKKEPLYREMYDKAVQGMHDELLRVSCPSGLTYLADRIGDVSKPERGRRTHHKMDHLCCFVGGMLALGAYTDPLGLESERAQRDLKTAKALTYTCYQMYARTNTGIAPEFAEFVQGQDFIVPKLAPHYLLRPETVESFYILHFLTGDPIYREWGWEVFLAIEKHCKTSIAYGSIKNVQDTAAKPRDDMESFFLAETLKYLYLLYDPDSKIDILEKHVFNTEAHPLRMFPLIDEEKPRKESTPPE